jgi:cyanobactin maturation PatA/PatG family protease
VSQIATADEAVLDTPRAKLPPQRAPEPAEPTRPAPAPTLKEQKSSGGGCGCSGKATATQVYALGQIDFDYGTEARRDSFIQLGLTHPNDPRQLLAHLDENPWDAARVIWTLVQETTPVYAVVPAGPFAAEGYARLRSFLKGQLEEGVSQVSIPGVEAGKATLLNGQTVPAVIPEITGMYSWSTAALVKAVLGEPPDNGQDRREYDDQSEEIANFLDRVYFELSNLGIASQERAVNYAATNAFQVSQVYKEAIKQELKLDTIHAERSKVCRPGADCWDVKLSFFDPRKREEKAREVYRFSVDVSDLIPVTVGKVRHWSVY